MLGRRARKPGAMLLADQALRAMEIDGTDLHCRGAEHEGGGDAARIANPAGGNHRHGHGIDDLREQCDQPHLLVGRIGEKAPGTPLGGPRQVEIVCLDGGQMMAPPPLPTSDPLALGSQSNSDPLLYVDPNGSVWVAFKRRYSRNAYRPSTLWETYLTRLDRDHWTTPMPLPKSWTRKSARLSLTGPLPAGPTPTG